MADHDDHHLSGKIILSLVHNIDGSQERPHLEDDFNVRDGHTASLDSIDAQGDDHHILDEQRLKNPTKELPEILQPILIPLNADPTNTILIAAFNQTNALIQQ